MSGSFAVPEETEQISMFGVWTPSVPQRYVDQLLVDGGNGRNSSLRIVSRFRKDFPMEDNAAFLQSEFRVGGRGFVLDGKQVSCFWDASGIRMAFGTSARTEDAAVISWMQAAKRIRELLDAGRYMDQDHLDMAEHVERRELAERLWSLYRDGLDGIPEAWDSHQGYPDDVNLIMEALEEPAEWERIAIQLRMNVKQRDENNPNRRRWHNAQQLIDDVTALQRLEIAFAANDPIAPPEKRFITQDEIDGELGAGAHIENFKYRVYQFYQSVHTPKEQSDFLKERYGIGRHSHACFGAEDAWFNCDGKGIVITRGELTNPYATTRMTWAQTASRVGELIKSGRYFTPAELEEYQRREETIPLMPAETPKAYELGFGELGNGITVWNRLEEEHGDYKTVAHVSDDGIVTIYDKNMPPDVADRIHVFAESRHVQSQTESALERWKEDHISEYGDEIVRRVAEDQSGEAPEQTMSRVFAEIIQENPDVHQIYMDDPDFRERLSEYVTSRIETNIPAEPVEQNASEQPAQTYEQRLQADDSSEVIAAVRAYAQYQQAYPQDVVFVRVGNHYETYGVNAERVRRALGTKLLERRTPEGETVAMTGFDPAERWPSQMTKLRAAGVDVAIVGLNDQGKYEIVKEGKAEDLVPVGAELDLDGHRFRVDRVNFEFGKVSLQDLTMFSSGYPLFRDEPIEWVHEMLQAQGQNVTPAVMEARGFGPHVPKPNEEVRMRTIVLDLTPKAESPERIVAGNYHIHDDRLGEGGARTKADRNLAAIRTLKELEAENRSASAEEQETLAQYVGWGGIPQIFDENHTDWKERQEALQSLLTEEEFASARASTLNAHYTSPVVIRAIYQALENMGLKQGSILEPACGIGNFFGMLPETMKDSKLYGVELDPLTGKIAQKLYPDARIQIRGFEHTALPDGFFDAAVGNVPFGAYSLADAKYDRYHFRIHDYFFAKSIDKVRPGGIIAFVTSKGTMDKQDSSVRRYIAQRAELLGAIRLPNNAFLANAGTDVTTDILFLQKRKRQMEIVPEWVDVGKNEDGVPVNQYFLDHPEMVLGRMTFDRSMYGNDRETACIPIGDANLSELLSAAIQNIHGRYEALTLEAPAEGEERIPADPEVPNFSYAIQDGRVYYRRDHWMERQELSASDEKRVRGMIQLRDLTRELIQAQLEGASDAAVGSLQMELKERYEAFTRQNGLLSDRRNAQVFREDDGYYLLTSLEILDENRKLLRTADMFTRRTIAQNRPIDHVDTAAEALAVSMAERAKVDLDYMAGLTGMEKDRLIFDLRGLIFQTPRGNLDPYEGWQTADEYLSGDVRRKLKAAELATETLGERFQQNVDALRTVQPKDLEPHEIDVRLGATWIPTEDISDFIHDLLNTPYYMRYSIKTEYSPATGAWYISNKSRDGNNDRANTQYGTNRRSAYKIIEESLNLRDVRVFDTVVDADGNEKRVLNQRETILAQQKQTAIREAFRDWIWKDPDRRARLCRLYNDTYNCIRPREYDGSHLRFVGMNPELNLRPHQKNAVARILYGGNTLLAHTVGAGKTAVMIASIMEKIRLGLGHKALVAVPNHLTEQTATEFLRFYPGAKILVATRRDFEKQNRKRFVGRIATGDYDAIIMGHSQFEKIPVSKERQKQMLEDQIQEIIDGIEEVKHSRGERFTVKELERTKKSLEARLKKLNSDEDKDSVITFEGLGVDMLYVDEAHSYKNCAKRCA